MPASKTTNPATEAAQRIIAAASKSISSAIKLADAAAGQFPDYRFPAEKQGDATPSFADVAAHLRQLAGPAPVQQEKSAQTKAAPAKRATAAKKAAPKAAAPKAAPKAEPAPEPAPVVPSTLKLVHDGVNQTAIFGTTPSSPASKALKAQGWRFWRVQESWYLQATQGYAPNMDKINAAVSVLESLTEDGQQLYRVETDITKTGPDGNPLPVKLDRAAAAAWQKEYTTRENLIYAAVQLGRGECAGCGETGLGEATSRKVKDDKGMPVLQCGTCGGFGAPTVEDVTPVKVDMSAIFKAPLALPAAPAVAEETAECPSCKTDQPVIDGKFKLHSNRGAACRGRVGKPVIDVEPEPKAAPAKAARKTATAAELGIVVTPAEVGTEIKFALQGGLSKTSAGQLATEVRSALSRQISKRGQFKGVMFSVFRDKAESKWVKVVITEGADGFDAAALDAEIERVTKTVRGIRNRMHKG